MSNAILLRTPSSNWRKPLLAHPSPTGKRQFSEVAGGTTAECAAICCCCPCTIVNLVVLAVYKLPACLYRRAIKMSKKRRLTKKGLLLQHRRGCPIVREVTETETQKKRTVSKDENSSAAEAEEATERKAAELLEKEMWERFHSTGFWKSLSQRETNSTVNN